MINFPQETTLSALIRDKKQETTYSKRWLTDSTKELARRWGQVRSAMASYPCHVWIHLRNLTMLFGLQICQLMEIQQLKEQNALLNPWIKNEKPNARAKGRGGKCPPRSPMHNPRPLERRVGRRTRKEWLLLLAFRSFRRAQRKETHPTYLADLPGCAVQTKRGVVCVRTSDLLSANFGFDKKT